MIVAFVGICLVAVVAPGESVRTRRGIAQRRMQEGTNVTMSHDSDEKAAANPRCGTQNCCRNRCGITDRNSELRCNGEQCLEDKTCCSGCCIDYGPYAAGRCSGYGDTNVKCRGNAPFPVEPPKCSAALQAQADSAAF